MPESDEEAILMNSVHGGGGGQPGAGCGAARQTGDVEAIGFAGAFHHPGSCWDPKASEVAGGSAELGSAHLLPPGFCRNDPNQTGMSEMHVG